MKSSLQKDAVVEKLGFREITTVEELISFWHGLIYTASTNNFTQNPIIEMQF